MDDKSMTLEETCTHFRNEIEFMVNRYGDEWIELFCKYEWDQIHRTNQQNFFRFIVYLTKAHANVSYPDRRNEASVAYCKKVLELVPEEYTRMPLV